LQLVFFGRRSTWRQKELQPGAHGLFSGKVGDFRGRRQLVHPEYLLLRGDGVDELDAEVYAGQLIPVYPATQAVRTWQISNAVHLALATLDPLPDPLPDEVHERHALLTYDAALRAMHEPDDFAHWAAARRRLAWPSDAGWPPRTPLNHGRRKPAGCSTRSTPGCRSS
jgi:ATP-dependent DNA helicase RecG